MFRKLLIALLTVSGLAQAQVPISGLPPANLPLQPTDQVIVNQTVSGAKSTRSANVSSFTTLSPPISAAYILQAPNVLIANSRTLSGSANQVILTDGGPGGTLTLSLPQPIGTLNTPTFGGMTLTGSLGGTSASFSGALSSSGYTGTSGSFSAALSALSLSLTNPLPATSGGTGFASYAIGDLLSASTTTALSKIPDVGAGSYLRSGGVGALPSWSNVILPNGATLGDTWYGSGANSISVLVGNTTGVRKFLTQTGTGATSAAPIWNAIGSSDLPGGFTGFANPSATIGLTVVNGIATTAMPSDSAPPLSQAIVPTWTNQHTYTTNGGGASSAIYVNSSTQPSIGFRDAAGAVDSKLWDWTTNGTQVLGRILNDAQSVARIFFQVDRTATAVTGVTVGNATDATVVTVPKLTATNLFECGSTGVSGRQCDLTTNSNTATGVGYFGIVDQAGARYGYFGKSGSGPIISYESDAGVQLVANNGTDIISIDTAHKIAYNAIPLTPVTGTFTLTYTGMTVATTCTATYYIVGNQATLSLCGATGTSNTTALTATGLPAVLQPATITADFFCAGLIDNTVLLITSTSTPSGRISAASGTITFFKAGNSAGWTAAGTKGMSNPTPVTYLLN